MNTTFIDRLETALLQSAIPLTQSLQEGGDQAQLKSAFSGVAQVLSQAPDAEAFRRGCFQVMDAYQSAGAPAGLSQTVDWGKGRMTQASKLALLAAVRETGASDEQIGRFVQVLSGMGEHAGARPDRYEIDWPQPEILAEPRRAPKP